LASAIKENNGRVLLTEGIELSEKTLASLHKRNVCCVSIKEEDGRSEEELALERNKTTEHIGMLFRNAASGTSIELLHQLILEYRLAPLS